ncbi:hypothetical protein EV648_101250 [Kribbella sp. VKM Ac-2568]|nr:hypothetical protein EV648_101250 [Kribbella sp. VKM Ac-2568]
MDGLRRSSRVAHSLASLADGPVDLRARALGIKLAGDAFVFLATRPARIT